MGKPLEKIRYDNQKGLEKEMIKSKERIKSYYSKNDIAISYDLKRFHNTFGRIQHEIEISIINNAISKFKNPRLLEIAVGTGRVTKAIKGKGIGIDTSDNMLKIAKKNAPKWRFIKMDVMDLHLKKKFEVVISLRLLRHFSRTDRKIAYKKIYESLSDNGLFIFDMPTGRHNKVLEVLDLFKKQNKVYEADTPLKELKEELNDSGFDVLDVYNTKYEGLFFRVFCWINDKLNAFYPVLRKYADSYLNKLSLATNVIIISKKKTTY